MTTPSLPPESWWERHFFPRMEALMQRAVNDLAAIVAGSGSGGGNAASPLQGPRAIFPIPMDALMVSRLAMAAGIPGITTPLVLRQVVTAPANGTATYTLPVSPGTVVVQVGLFEGNASAHDATITATITVDNQRSPISDMPGTADIETIIPAYAPVRNEITANFVNGTPDPVEFTVTFQMAIVDATEYNTIWQPLFYQDYTLLRTLAQSLQSTGGGSA